MSILLDALKRSEAQRRLGTAPSIHSGTEDTPVTGDADYPWIPYLMGALTLVAISWIGVRQYQVPDTQSEAGQTIGTTVDTTVENSVKPSELPEHAAQPAQRTMVEKLVERSTPSDETDSPAGESTLENIPDTAQREGLANRFNNYSGDDDTSDDVESTVIPESAATSDRIVDSQVAESQTDNTDDVMRKGIDPYEAEPLNYWALPQSIRDDMSEIKISVMVYADDSSDRFLLVNGQRLLENERSSIQLSKLSFSGRKVVQLGW
jgi:hypothetical protein